MAYDRKFRVALGRGEPLASLRIRIIGIAAPPCMMLEYRLYQPAIVNSAILVWQHFAPLVSKFGNTLSNKVANPCGY